MSVKVGVKDEIVSKSGSKSCGVKLSVKVGVKSEIVSDDFSGPIILKIDDAPPPQLIMTHPDQACSQEAQTLEHHYLHIQRGIALYIQNLC